jgi:hypothetical protein
MRGISNGTTQFVFGANGRVGIGTDNPASPLQVVSSANNIVQIRSTTRYSTMYIFDSIGSTFIQCDSGNLRFGTGGGANASGGETERLRIDSDGQIGIGNITPDTWSTGHGLTIGTSQATLWGVGDQVNLSGNAYFNSGCKCCW